MDQGSMFCIRPRERHRLLQIRRLSLAPLHLAAPGVREYDFFHQFPFSKHLLLTEGKCI